MRDNGFTLIELAVVLLIISLIVGGIVTGSSLIHSSRIASVIKDFSKYESAIGAFRVKFDDAIPGDMRNATDIWGAEVFNGNGNRAICTNAVFMPDPETEIMGFFEHLSKAGMIEGSYNGHGDEEIGVNLPSSSIEQATFRPRCFENIDDYFNPPFIALMADTGDTILEFRKLGSEGAALAPKDAYLIDKKTDDGYPGRGDLLGARSQEGSAVPNNCSTGTNKDTDRYLLSDTRVTCRIGRVLNFN